MPVPDSHEPIRLIRLPQVAEIMGVHATTITRWVRAGVFPKPVRLNPQVRRSAIA